MTNKCKDKLESKLTNKNHAITDLSTSLPTLSNNQVEYNLVKFVYPILLIFGLLGNLLSCIAMIKRYYKNEKNPISGIASKHIFPFTLAILCLANGGILFIACLSQYVEHIFEFSLREVSNLSCKLFYFSCYFFRYSINLPLMMIC